MVDQWSSTPPSPQEFPYKGSDGFTQVLDVIEKQKRELDEMRNNLLATAGISVEPDRLRVLGALAVDGDAVFGGNTTIGGNAKITGTLDLPAGIIGNDALASPVTGDSKNASTGAAGVSISTGGGNFATVSFAVPTGFTKAVVTAVSTAFVYGSGGVGDTMIQTVINGTGGELARIYTATGGFGNGGNSYAATLTGLSGGGSFTVTTRCTATTSGVTGMVITSASAIFLR